VTAEIEAGFQAQAGRAVGGAEADAGLHVAVGRLAAAVERQVAQQALITRAVHPIAVPAAAIAGNGTIDDPMKFGPRDGYAWDMKRVTAASFTAGTVAVYKNAVADANQLFTFTSAGTWWITGNDMILMPGDRLLFVGAGITGNITISGDAIQVELAWLGAYLL